MKVLCNYSDTSIQILNRETGSTVINGKYVIDLPPGTSATPDEILSLGIDTVIGNKLIELNPEFNAQDSMIIDGVVVNIPRSSADSWLLTSNTEIDNSDSFGKTEEEYVLYELADYHKLLKTRYQFPSAVPTVNSTVLSDWIEYYDETWAPVPAPGMIITDDIDFSTIPGMGMKSVPEELMVYWSIQMISTTDDTPPSFGSRANVPVYKESTSLSPDDIYVYMSTDSGATYSRVRSLEPITLNVPMFMEPFTMRLVFINLNPYKVCLSHFAFLYSVEQIP